jgi:hypothetical protein
VLVFPFRAVIIAAFILGKMLTLFLFRENIAAKRTAVGRVAFRLLRFLGSSLMITYFTLKLLVTVRIMTEAVEIFFGCPTFGAFFNIYG